MQDYINIELDNHRNQLIRLELLLTAATFSVALVGGVSGIFGMNLNNNHQDSYTVFVLVRYGLVGVALQICVVLLDFPLAPHLRLDLMGVFREALCCCSYCCFHSCS